MEWCGFVFAFVVDNACNVSISLWPCTLPLLPFDCCWMFVNEEDGDSVEVFVAVNVVAVAADDDNDDDDGDVADAVEINDEDVDAAAAAAVDDCCWQLLPPLNACIVNKCVELCWFECCWWRWCGKLAVRCLLVGGVISPPSSLSELDASI